MTTVITATKCLRPSCKNRSADPETDDWTYIDFEQLVVGFAPETGFYCKPCTDEIMPDLNTDREKETSLQCVTEG